MWYLVTVALETNASLKVSCLPRDHEVIPHSCCFPSLPLPPPSSEPPSSYFRSRLLPRTLSSLVAHEGGCILGRCSVQEGHFRGQGGETGLAQYTPGRNLILQQGVPDAVLLCHDWSQGIDGQTLLPQNLPENNHDILSNPHRTLEGREPCLLNNGREN